MPGHRRLLIIVADGEHVRFVRPASDNALHSDAAVDSISAHKKSADLGSDHPGAAYHTGSTAHHALGPRHDPHDLEKEKFARLIADRLNADSAGGEFEELVLVAPAHVLTGIRDHLDAATTARIVGTLAKDLVNVPDDELWPHVRAWVRPTHRAP